MQPEYSKIAAIENFEKPNTKKAVRTFFGMTGYYRKFIPDYSTVVCPLTDLTRSKAPSLVTWNAHCETAFQHLKKYLCSKPILRSPDFNREFVLQTDASERGVGAVLIARTMMKGTNTLLLTLVANCWSMNSTIEKQCLARESAHFEHTY